MKQNKWKHLKFEKYVFVLLLAIELIMSFTFLGFIHIDPISLTTAYIPIVVAGCLLGPLESTLIGLVFGLASMYKASALYVVSDDKIFSPLYSGNPIRKHFTKCWVKSSVWFCDRISVFHHKRTKV